MDAPPPDHRQTRMPTRDLAVVAVLILIPIVALMWVSSYAKREPELWGMPFFYWYQFCWVFATAILTSIAYRIVSTYERRRRAVSRGTGDITDEGSLR